MATAKEVSRNRALDQVELFMRKTSPAFVSKVLTEELMKVDKTIKTISEKKDYSKLRYSELQEKVDDLSKAAVNFAYFGDMDMAGKKFAEAVKIVDEGVRDEILASNLLRGIAETQKNVGMKKEAEDTRALMTHMCIS